MNSSIKVEATDKALSSFGGLNIFSSCWHKLRLGLHLSGLLPLAPKSEKKFEDLALGFAAGAECLDDMAAFSRDEGFRAIADDKVYTPKAYGDYLRSFTGQHIDELNRALARTAFEQRALLRPKMKSMTLDFDSTSNRQYAEKMQGVTFSGEKGYECLTTMYVFDELGNQYYSDVRPGNAHTSQDISKIIHMVMSEMPKVGSYKAEEIKLPWLKNPYNKKLKVYARADAGYSNKEYMNACFAKEIGFVVRMRADMLEPCIKNIRNWKKAKQRLRKVSCRGGGTRVVDETLRFYDGRAAEIGSTVYHTKGLAKTARVVCLRAKKPGRLGLREDDYDYFAWLTSIGEHEMNNEKIVIFYRGRGHAENYIREMKNGYDMHHYPCLKLAANRAYALIAAFAYNILRFIALRSASKKTHFAKAIRNRFINLPCQVVRKAGKVIFRLMDQRRKEVEAFLSDLKNLQYGFT